MWDQTHLSVHVLSFEELSVIILTADHQKEGSSIPYTVLSRLEIDKQKHNNFNISSDLEGHNEVYSVDWEKVYELFVNSLSR